MKYAGIIEVRGYSAHKILILTGQGYLDTRIYAAEQGAVSEHQTAKDRLILLLSDNANCHFKLKPILVHHPQYPTAGRQAYSESLTGIPLNEKSLKLETLADSGDESYNVASNHAY